MEQRSSGIGRVSCSLAAVGGRGGCFCRAPGAPSEAAGRGAAGAAANRGGSMDRARRRVSISRRSKRDCR